jgi:type IV pilus assembly protein PilV
MNMRTRNGFTLLEFLITLLIVSIGLLGIAGIVSNSLKNNQSAYYRSQAVLLAADIIDRMRANRKTAEGASPSPYNLLIGTAPGSGTVPGDDLTDWRTALTETLPSGTGSVDLDNGTKKVTIVVQWDDTRGAGGGSTQQTVVETRL